MRRTTVTIALVPPRNLWAPQENSEETPIGQHLKRVTVLWLNTACATRKQVNKKNAIGPMRRRNTGFFVSLAAYGITVAFGLVLLNSLAIAEAPPQSGAVHEALARLEQGNERCVEGKSAHGHNLANWRERYIVNQKPFATVLGCSDSRVPPELLFDQGFGDLFVIRVAGNIVEPSVIASIQYAVEHLDNKLIVVLGHQHCGAVSAALSPPNQTKGEPPELRKLLDRIRPAIAPLDRYQERERLLSAAIEANARASVIQLRQVPSIAAAIRTKNVKVVGAVYRVDSGKITFLDE